MTGAPTTEAAQILYIAGRLQTYPAYHDIARQLIERAMKRAAESFDGAAAPAEAAASEPVTIEHSETKDNHLLPVPTCHSTKRRHSVESLTAAILAYPHDAKARAASVGCTTSSFYDACHSYGVRVRDVLRSAEDAPSPRPPVVPAAGQSQLHTAESLMAAIRANPDDLEATARSVGCPTRDAFVTACKRRNIAPVHEANQLLIARRGKTSADLVQDDPLAARLRMQPTGTMSNADCDEIMRRAAAPPPTPSPPSAHRIRNRHENHCRPKPALKQRSCMTCEKPFLSEGPHNRMCTGCRHRSEGIAA